MDINDVRGFATVLVLIAFAGVCWWAYSPSRKKRFEEAANLPFADDLGGGVEDHIREDKKNASTNEDSKQ